MGRKVFLQSVDDKGIPYRDGLLARVNTKFGGVELEELPVIGEELAVREHVGEDDLELRGVYKVRGIGSDLRIGDEMRTVEFPKIIFVSKKKNSYSKAYFDSPRDKRFPGVLRTRSS